MSKARLIITAVVVEGRSKSEVARDYDVSRYWVQQLVRRFAEEGEAAFEPHSKRPHASPHAVPVGVEEQIIRLRKELTQEWLLALAGVLSVAFGVLLVMNPGAGALSVILVIGAYALMFGLLLLMLAFKLRSVRMRLAPA